MTLCCDFAKTDDMKNRMYSVKQLLEMQNELNNHLPFGKGWPGLVSIPMFQVAIVDEFSEFLGSGVQWKWWGNPVDPSNFDFHNAKIEITDIIHFWLSIAILKIMKMNELDDCKPKNPFDVFDSYYVGSDMGHMKGVGYVSVPNNLIHDNFMKLVSKMLSEDFVECRDFSFQWIDVMDKAVSGIGMSCEEFSAYYAAKSQLNAARWDIRVTSGDYQKVQDGIEDNERLEPLIQAFLDNPDMTLEELREDVFEEFYEQVT